MTRTTLKGIVITEAALPALRGFTITLKKETVSLGNSVTEQEGSHQIATGARALRRTESNLAELELRGEFRSDNFRIHVALANVETLVGVQGNRILFCFKSCDNAFEVIG